LLRCSDIFLFSSLRPMGPKKKGGKDKDKDRSRLLKKTQAANLATTLPRTTLSSLPSAATQQVRDILLDTNTTSSASSSSSLPVPVIDIILEYYRACDRLLLLATWRVKQEIISKEIMWSLSTDDIIRLMFDYQSNNPPTAMAAAASSKSSTTSAIASSAPAVPVTSMPFWIQHTRWRTPQKVHSHYYVDVKHSNGSSDTRLIRIGLMEDVNTRMSMGYWQLNNQILRHSIPYTLPYDDGDTSADNPYLMYATDENDRKSAVSLTALAPLMTQRYVFESVFLTKNAFGSCASTGTNSDSDTSSSGSSTAAKDCSNPQILIVGGITDGGRPSSSSIDRYDMSTNTWSVDPVRYSTPLPPMYMRPYATFAVDPLTGTLMQFIQPTNGRY
jgi:hypothetical protein